jgi:hypothetical protein
MSNIIPKTFNNKEIFFDNQDGIIYLNATKTAIEFNKRLDNWKNSKEVLKYIDALSKHLNLGFGDLMVVSKGGNNKNEMGTWLHPKLIIMFARWLSPDFAVWCDLQIEEILKSKNSTPQPVQTSQNFDLDSYISENEKMLKLIELITSKHAITLHYLDKLTHSLNIKSPLELLKIDLNSYYFIPTELGKFLNKSAVEVNKILEKKGFQEKIDGVWQLTESGEKYAIQLDNNYKTIKWKLESLV